MKDKITGLDTFYSGHSNSNYANTVAEYTGTNGAVGPVTTHLGSVIDASSVDSTSTSAVLAATPKIR